MKCIVYFEKGEENVISLCIFFTFFHQTVILICHNGFIVSENVNTASTTTAINISDLHIWKLFNHQKTLKKVYRIFFPLGIFCWRKEENLFALSPTRFPCFHLDFSMQFHIFDTKHTGSLRLYNL